MNNLFQANKRESAVDIVVNSIKQLLIERRLKPGDKIPSELEISEGLGVSRGSVREAMKILSAFGIVEVKVGNGTYIVDAPTTAMLDSFLFSFFLLNPGVGDIYEFRQMFETDILKLILRHYEENDEERAALRKNLDALAQMIKDKAAADDLADNDIKFHRLLAKASKNLLSERIYNFIIDFMEPSIVKTHDHQHGELAYKVHSQIVSLIERRDASRIEDVIANSIDTWSILQPDWETA